MNLTDEIVAKLIFQVSQLRWLEREYANDPNWYKRDEILTIQRRIDEFLIINGWHEHMSKADILKSLKEEPKIKKAS